MQAKMKLLVQKEGHSVTGSDSDIGLTHLNS